MDTTPRTQMRDDVIDGDLAEFVSQGNEFGVSKTLRCAAFVIPDMGSLRAQHRFIRRHQRGEADDIGAGSTETE